MTRVDFENAEPATSGQGVISIKPVCHGSCNLVEIAARFGDGNSKKLSAVARV